MQAGPEPRPGEILMTSQTVFAVGEFQSPDIRRCQWSVWRENLQFGAHQLQLHQHSDTLPSDCRKIGNWKLQLNAIKACYIYCILRHVAGYVEDLLGLAQVADDRQAG